MADDAPYCVNVAHHMRAAVQAEIESWPSVTHGQDAEAAAPVTLFDRLQVSVVVRYFQEKRSSADATTLSISVRNTSLCREIER